MTEIDDDDMQRELAASRIYTLLILHRTEGASGQATSDIVHEHARRNFALRADGILPIVCPAVDDGPYAGIGLFDATLEETDRIMRDDPGVAAGIFTYELHAVRGFPGDALPGLPAGAEAHAATPPPRPAAEQMYLSVHTLAGDAATLLAAKHEHMDPVVDRLAPSHGAVASITVAGSAGLTTCNVWHDAEGAARFSQEPAALQAQQQSRLPAPETFMAYPDVEVTLY